MQEEGTYYDVQLLRQPTKNEQRKLVPGAGSAKPQASPAVAQQSPQAPQSALDRASLSQSMDKARIDVSFRQL